MNNPAHKCIIIIIIINVYLPYNIIQPGQTLDIVSNPSESPTSEETELTRINLHDLRQCQPHLVSIHRRPLGLQWVPFKIHRLQLLFIPQLALHLLETRQFVVGCPQLFQVLQMGDVFQLRNFIVGEIQDAQRGIGLESTEVGDGVMR